jgi:hypothetical protein
MLMAMFPHGPLPTARAQDIIGGPQMDACIVGSRELYPGQTVPLQISVMNEGVLTYALGFTTPAAVTGSSGSSYSYNASSSSTSTAYTNAQYAAALGQASALQQQYVSQASAQSGSFSYTGAPFGDVELNSRSDLSCGVTTAFGMSCWLSTGIAPIELVSDPHFVVGSLAAGCVFTMTYIARVSYDAKPGLYALPLTITYKRLADNLDLQSAWGPTLTYNNYVEETQTVVVYVVVRDMFNLVVCDIGTQNMVPGGDGVVSVKVCNLGNIDADDAVVYLIPSGIAAQQDYDTSLSDGGIETYDNNLLQSVSKSVQSMVVPAQSSQYLGHMGPGDQKVVDFKVSISPDAEEGDYPVCAIVSYSDQYDVQKSSNIDTVGVHVEPEMKFVSDGSPVRIKRGTTMDVKLNLTNTGPMTARDAIVRMNALDPFVVSYDTLYLGDMSPQQTTNTTFGIKVKPDAVPSTYYVTLEVKYYDSNDDPHVTKVIRKAITVLPPPTLLDTLMDNWPLLLGLLAILLIGVLYAGSGYLKRGKKPPSKPEPPPIKAAAPEREGESSAK